MEPGAICSFSLHCPSVSLNFVIVLSLCVISNALSNISFFGIDTILCYPESFTHCVTGSQSPIFHFTLEVSKYLLNYIEKRERNTTQSYNSISL